MSWLPNIVMTLPRGSARTPSPSFLSPVVVFLGFFFFCGRTFLFLFACCMSPISTLRYAWKRCILISRPCRTTRSLLVCFYGEPSATHHLAAPFYVPSLGIYISFTIKRKCQQWLLPGLRQDQFNFQLQGWSNLSK